MREQTDDDPSPRADRTNDWGVALAIALTILICLAAFAWIFVELDPFMSDFTGTDAIVTPDPSASPIEGTENADQIETP